MIRRSQRMRLLDMAAEMSAIEAAMTGRTEAEFKTDWLLRSAVERGMEIISEASRHVDPLLLAQHPEVPWRRVADIGNWLRHAYDKVEPSLIYAIVIEQFPILRAAISALLLIVPED